MMEVEKFMKQYLSLAAETAVTQKLLIALLSMCCGKCFKTQQFGTCKELAVHAVVASLLALAGCCKTSSQTCCVSPMLHIERRGW